MFKKGFVQGLGVATGFGLFTLAAGGIGCLIVKRKMRKTGEKFAESLTGAVADIATTTNPNKE